MLRLYDNCVYVAKESPYYCRTAPYHPSEPLPEWPGMPIGQNDNPGYRAVRALFHHIGLDAVNYDSAQWNPLRQMSKPGGVSLLKPNLVRHNNPGSKGSPFNLECLITHGSIVRAVFDYVAKGMEGTGCIIIADAPVQGCNWDAIVPTAGLDALSRYAREMWPGIEVRVADLRLTRSIVSGGVMVGAVTDDKAMHLYQEVDLGTDSLLCSLMDGKSEFGVSQYPRYRMRAAHTLTVNKYLFPKAILNADLVVSLPKMKTHQKAGMTGALKNFVGLNGHKDYLPHFRFGSPSQGGDEYPDGGPLWHCRWACSHRAWEVESGWAKRFWSHLGSAIQIGSYKFGIVDREQWSLGGGSWCGNDTLWRTILDINRAFFYYEPRVGSVGSRPRSSGKYLAILDGLVGGEGEGPLSPQPVASGVLLAARNPVALDTVASVLMGLDYHLVKQIAESYRLGSRPLAHFQPEEIEIVGDLPFARLAQVIAGKYCPRFKPAAGWRGRVEAC